LVNQIKHIYKAITVPVVLYGCETWSLGLKEEHSLRVFRRLLGPKRDVVAGGWRKLHNEELHRLYPSPSIIRMLESKRMRWAGHSVLMGEKSNAYMTLMGKPRYRWVDNIKMDLREIEWDGMDWIELAQVGTSGWLL
jgi:hypothetical protein